MNDIVNQQEEADDVVGADELTVLKQRARLMGLQFSNNIGLAALRSKLEAKQNESEDTEGESQVGVVNALEPGSEKPRSIRQIMREDQMKLVRLRITNMDPKKKDLPGEILTIANEYLGTVSKYIPFGEVTDNGYHVPYCLYQMMKERKFVNIRTIKSANGGVPRTETSMAKEFSLEILPPLTKVELERLGTAQAAAGTFTQPNG